MKAQKLLDQIMPILYTVKEDPVKLEKILQFLLDEIYEEPEEEEIEVPEKYLKAVAEIAGGLDAGLFCFLNMDTLETEVVPESFLVDLDEFEQYKEEWGDNIEFKYPSWENCMTFEPLESHESFKIMERYTNQLEDKKLQIQLVNALNHRKPFAHFKFIIDNSVYRQDWFDFKKHRLEIYVKELLSLELEKKEGKFELDNPK
ncbi:MAG TPA: UPF0158 family protein [Prolixibacteraceae bacterium]|jgi:hypothetical protein